jgi:hypothetical protein
MFFSHMAPTDAAKECLIRQILSNAHDGMLMSVIGSEYSKRNELIPFGKGLGSFMKARGTIFSCDEERWSLRRQISESKSFEVKRIASSSSSSVVSGKKKRLAEMRNNLMTIFHQFPSKPVEFLSEYLRLHESISANHLGEFFKCTVHQRLRVFIKKHSNHFVNKSTDNKRFRVSLSSLSVSSTVQSITKASSVSSSTLRSSSRTIPATTITSNGSTESKGAKPWNFPEVWDRRSESLKSNDIFGFPKWSSFASHTTPSTKDKERVDTAVEWIVRMIGNLRGSRDIIEIVVGGSHGKGTAIKGRNEADCVIIRNDFEPTQKWRLDNLKVLKAGLEKELKRLTESDSKMNHPSITDNHGRGLKLRVPIDGQDVDIDLLLGGKLSASSDFLTMSPEERKCHGPSASPFQLEAIQKMPECYKSAVRMAKWLFRSYYKEQFVQLSKESEFKKNKGWFLRSCAIEVLVGHAYHKLRFEHKVDLRSSNKNIEYAALIFAEFLLVATSSHLNLINFTGCDGGHSIIGSNLANFKLDDDWSWSLIDPGNPTKLLRVHPRTISCFLHGH